MTTETQKANQPDAAEAEAPTRRWMLIFGLYFVILSLLACPAAAQQATSPSSQPTATAGHGAKPGGGGDLATIIESRCTNFLGYNVVVHNDGSATVEIRGAMQQFPPETIDTTKLRSPLTTIGDVSRIPIGFCAKSASFGTTTKIAYAGKTSGDLQCVQQQASGGDPALLQASQDLAKFVMTTRNQLKIDARRVIPDQ
jgi:hypothetical protein